MTLSDDDRKEFALARATLEATRGVPGRFWVHVNGDGGDDCTIGLVEGTPDGIVFDVLAGTGFLGWHNAEFEFLHLGYYGPPADAEGWDQPWRETRDGAEVNARAFIKAQLCYSPATYLGLLDAYLIENPNGESIGLVPLGQFHDVAGQPVVDPADRAGAIARERPNTRTP